MIKKIKKMIPEWIKHYIRITRKYIRYRYRKIHIKWMLKNQQQMKIILGAAETSQQGWFSTNEQWLDITKEEHWSEVFQHRACLSHVVAEHVFEHLTYQQAQDALRLIKKHMLPQGKIRIAVPDGYHPDPIYLKHIEINGIGDDASDHKQLLNVDTLCHLLKEAGFIPEHIEGYTLDGKLVQKAVEKEGGFIQRSRSNRDVQTSNVWGFPDANTSLIVDGQNSPV